MRPCFATLAFASILGLSCAACAQGFVPGDPMVRITAPPALEVDPPAVIEQLSRDVEQATGLERTLVSYYWQRFDAILTAGTPTDSYPIFVDLYVPGFLTDEMVAKFMLGIAASLAQHTGIDEKWVFIHTHTAQPGRVLLNGEVQQFDETPGAAAGGEPEEAPALHKAPERQPPEAQTAPQPADAPGAASLRAEAPNPPVRRAHVKAP